jgi:hypothetical protein
VPVQQQQAPPVPVQQQQAPPLPVQQQQAPPVPVQQQQVTERKEAAKLRAQEQRKAEDDAACDKARKFMAGGGDI